MLKTRRHYMWKALPYGIAWALFEFVVLSIWPENLLSVILLTPVAAIAVGVTISNREDHDLRIKLWIHVRGIKRRNEDGQDTAKND